MAIKCVTITEAKQLEASMGFLSNVEIEEGVDKYLALDKNTQGLSANERMDQYEKLNDKFQRLMTLNKERRELLLELTK